VAPMITPVSCNRRSRLYLFFLHGFARGPIPNQLSATEQANAAHIADDGVTLLQGPEISDQALPIARCSPAILISMMRMFSRRSRSRGTSGKGRDIAEIRQRILGIILERSNTASDVATQEMAA